MFCKSCGKEIDDKAVMCPACGAAVGAAKPAAAPAINNHLGGAIFATLCCCLPGGIVAIIYATKVNTLIAQGDYAGAQKAANTANNWIIASVVLGLIGMVINFVVQFAAAAAQ